MTRAPTRPPRVVSAGPRLAAKAQADRRDRRRALGTRFSWAMAVVLPLGMLGWVLLGSSWLAVNKLVVSGEARVTSAQIIAAAEVQLGTPLARIDLAAVAHRIRVLDAVQDVTVSRGWPTSLRIKIVERVPFVAVRSPAGVQLLDNDGYSLGPAAIVPAGVITLQVADPTRADPSTAAALTVLRGLPTSLLALLSSAKAASPEQVTLLLKDGRQVLWGGAHDEAAKSAATLALLTFPGTNFDVSAPGVVTRR